MIGLLIAMALMAPAPPKPPGPMGVGTLMDGLLLGGTVTAIRRENWHREVENYELQFIEFDENLTPPQRAEIMNDAAARYAYERGVFFIQTYDRVIDGRRPMPEVQNGANESVMGANQPIPNDGNVTVYEPSECIGAVVNGVCHGSILPRQATHPVCHGNMINGVCTGPVF